MAFRDALVRAWGGRGWMAISLYPFSLVFAALSAARRVLYRWGVLRSQRLNVPIVVVGNITVGGSGKTPLVLCLARALRDLGWHPGIVSRGYGAHVELPREVTCDALPKEVGDEPLLLARRSDCPVWVGRDRVAAARALLAAHPHVNVMLCDDGLQHYRLVRDVEIVVIDRRGFGNSWLLPAGPLREPTKRLAGVDALVLNDALPPCDFGEKLLCFKMQLRGERFVDLYDPSRQVLAADLAGKRLHAVAGIGDPQRFFRHLEALSLSFVAHPFPDHHVFSDQDFSFTECDAILMTEKDAVKCAGLSLPPVWVLPVDAEIEPDLAEWLKRKLYGLASA